jgi:hypothetical protein
MKYLNTIILFVVFTLNSCHINKNNNQLVEDISTIEYLHSTFNESELSVDEFTFNEPTIKIITFGHIYSLLNFPEIFDEFISTVIEQKPDYVFILGDIVYENSPTEWDIVLEQFSKFKCKVYYAPGNHDINYFRERAIGIRKNQWETENNYLQKIGYRYKLIKDNFANYLLLNLNDSLSRIENYLTKIDAEIDTTKPTFVLTHQCVWNKATATKDPATWSSKPMKREDLLQSLMNYDVLIHGDWNKKFFEGPHQFANKSFKTISVGNKVIRIPFFITSIVISDSNFTAKPITINIPEESKWFK